MTFTTRPYDDYCPDIGHCAGCGNKLCTSCGGDFAPVDCGDDIHCTGCLETCAACLNEEDAR